MQTRKSDRKRLFFDYMNHAKALFLHGAFQNPVIQGVENGNVI
jgi:hypothetical protein